MGAQVLTQRLGELVSRKPAGISEAAIERAKVSILHNLAMALAGRRIETVAWRIASAGTATGPATLLANGGKVSAEDAAFANAALIHARSQDDTHAPSTSHPGAPTLAAALAVGEAMGASGRDVLEAVVLGYEVLGTVGSEIDELLTARGYRAAPVLGIFGAAAAASRLFGLSAEASGHALGLATHMAAGLAQVWQEGSAEGPLQLGFAARNGVFAARCAAEGATAALAAIEGPRGLFAALSGQRPQVDLRAANGPWMIEAATIKAFPACAILQGPLERLARWIAKGGKPAAVDQAQLMLSPYEAGYPGIDNAGPFGSPTATKLSAQFCLGAMLARGGLSRADLEATADPATLARSAIVSVQIDPQLQPRQSRIALSIEGTMVTLEQLQAVGQPSIGDAMRSAMAMGPEAGITAEAMERWTQGVLTLEAAPDLSALIAALCAEAGAAA